MIYGLASEEGRPGFMGVNFEKMLRHGARPVFLSVGAIVHFLQNALSLGSAEIRSLAGKRRN